MVARLKAMARRKRDLGPFDPDYRAALHDDPDRRHPRRHRAQHRAQGLQLRFRVPAAAGRRSRERDRRIARLRRGNSCCPKCARCAPETAIAFEELSAFPGLDTAADAEIDPAGRGADRRQRHRQGRVRHRGRAVPASRHRDRRLRPRIDRAGAQARRIHRSRPDRAVREVYRPAVRACRSPDRGAAAPARAVLFDLGGVLVDWNPRHLYRQIFAEERAMEEFLATICTQAWNEEQDCGRPFAEGVRLLVERHPHLAEEIRAYDARWHEMLKGPIEDSVALLAELRTRGVWPLRADQLVGREIRGRARPLSVFRVVRRDRRFRRGAGQKAGSRGFSSSRSAALASTRSRRCLSTTWR